LAQTNKSPDGGNATYGKQRPRSIETPVDGDDPNSPNGEARDLIESKGLAHTSMSVGDVIVVDGEAHMVANFGFDKLGRNRRITELDRLKHKLDEARLHITQLMPPKTAEVLISYDVSADLSDWFHNKAVDHVLDIAKADPSVSTPLETRGFCPLCDQHKQKISFSLPEGLRRHLNGYGNMSWCPVTNAAFALARDEWLAARREREAAERAQKRKRKNEMTMNRQCK
jgi:hypothetical protein